MGSVWSFCSQMFSSVLDIFFFFYVVEMLLCIIFVVGWEGSTKSRVDFE